MIKVREHRQLLSDSLDTVQEIEPTKQALWALIEKSFEHWPTAKFTIDDVSVSPYGFDDRIGWDTHIVVIKGYGVFGFTNGPVSG